MTPIFAILRGITRHPLNKGQRARAVIRFLRWQLGTALLGRWVIVDWVDTTRFIAQKGEAGLTGNLYCGLMECEDMSFLLHYARSTDSFYDIGANVGAYTILASGVRGCQSYTFEPLPDTYDRLRDQIMINRIDHLVTTRNCGVGAKAEVLEFTNSLNCMNRVNTDPDNTDVTKVPVVTLDETCNPTAPSIVKIDVEGYEKFVLEGGSAFLSHPNVGALIIELNGSGIKFGVSDDDLDQSLRQFGFVPVRYDPFSRQLRSRTHYARGGNTIYVRDVAAAAARCKTAASFTVHTVGGRTI